MNECARIGLLLSLVMVIIINDLNGQVTFNKTIDFNEGDEGVISVVVLEDGYVLIGNGWGYEAGEYLMKN